jgi:amino acid adenylation domain-containing protein
MQNVNGFQLSLQQAHLWRAERRAGVGDAAAQSLWRLRGPLRAEALRESVRRAVERHEILRTTYRHASDLELPFQVVGDEATFDWREADLSGLEDAGLAAEVEALLAGERRESSEAAGDARPRAALFKVAPDEHLFALTLPALNADHVTLRLLFEEVVGDYAGDGADEAFDEADAPLQYADYAAWQHEMLEGGEEAATAQPAPPDGPALPFARAASPAEARGLRRLSLNFDGAERERVAALAERYETRPGVLLFACWQTLLWRLTGAEQITTHYLTEGRGFDELRRSLGRFDWYVPLGVRASEQLTFAELLRQLERAVRQLPEHPHAEKGDAGRGAVTANGFAYAELPAPREAAGLSCEVLSQRVWGEGLALSLNCFGGGAGFSCELEYEPSVYEEAEARRLGDEFRTLLGGVTAAPEGALGDYELLSATERERLLAESRGEPAPRPGASCFHELFEEQAARTPDAAALRYEGSELTYRELNERANRLAHHLRGLGVGPERRVAILLERSPEVVVAALATLKAGGAYVPVDVTQPAKRLELILEDTAPAAIITEQWRGETLAVPSSAALVYADAHAAAFEAESAENPAPAATPENLAYVIYTSGSTGKPKGVCVGHRQLLGYVRGVEGRLGLEAGASYALVSTFSADLGHTVIFPALASGGCLHVMSEERISDPEAFAAYFARHEIDCLKIVPSHLEALLYCSRPAGVLPRRVLVLGGEAARPSLVERLRALAPECRVINHYGPTETTVGVLTCDVSLGEEPARTPPLGRPLPNVSAHVLDARMNPSPVWVRGELYVGGDTVARGYLNRPALTAERFIPDPFSDKPGARLYRTGDVTRRLPDGALEFLGRADDQVKVRGYRVEPGEVEAALARHERVREAVVAVREDVPGEKTLVAYVVAGVPAPSSADLRQHLGELLPEYLIPSAFVALDRLPLTPNGKLDRRALPAPGLLDGHGESVAPRDDIEEVLARIWSEVLAMDDIGVYDNFFELGGHSLMGMQVFSRVRNSFQIDVPLRLLFESPTIADLAAALVANEEHPGQVAATAAVLLKVEDMSAEDVHGMLGELEVGG